jgi:hypothetical protein
VIAHGCPESTATAALRRRSRRAPDSGNSPQNDAVLYALDGRTGQELYNSGSAIGSWVHFSGLAIAEGRVFSVDYESQVYCFGLKGK